MARYAFPAIFTKEEKGYSISFPDLDGCFTCGDDLADGIFMAEDALALFLYDMEETGVAIPSPTAADAVAVGSGSFVVPIACDTMVYRKRNNTRAVKKTLSIPEWLNEIALEQNVNFSQVLQDALMEKCGV